MKNKFLISEDEKSRILEMHKSSTKNLYLNLINEQTAYERYLERSQQSPEESRQQIQASKDFINSVANLSKYIVSNLLLNNVVINNLPLHLRALYYYLIGNTETKDESMLKSGEKDYLWDVATKYGLKNGFKYDMWRTLGAQNLPTAITPEGIKSETERLKNNPQSASLSNPGLAGEFMYTLGEITKGGVRKIDDNTIQIRDNYDFNAFNLPKDEVLKQFSDTLSMFWKGDASLYSLIRKLVALKETDGYKGYPITYTIKNPGVSTTTTQQKSGNLTLPFKNKQEGDAFRMWVNTKYPEWAKKYKLDKSGSYKNSYIKRAFQKYGQEYLQSSNQQQTQNSGLDFPLVKKLMNNFHKTKNNDEKLQVASSTDRPYVLVDFYPNGLLVLQKDKSMFSPVYDKTSGSWITSNGNLIMTNKGKQYTITPNDNNQFWSMLKDGNYLSPKDSSFVQ
jgi:hypothetical protein